ncbi:MAG: magnesium transporter [Rickettsiales bacterium]|nr:magnesium transporter [Rickettsiales bacterium]
MEKKPENNFESEFGIDQNIKNRLLNSLENNLTSQVKKLFLELHPADQADFLSSLNFEQRAKLITNIAGEFDPEILTYLNDDLKNEVIEFLGSKNSAKAIDQLDVDDAVQVIETLENQGISEILDHVSQEKRSEIEEALSYPENSIGRLMQQNFIAVKQDWSVAQATYHLQNAQDLPQDFHNIVIVDDDFHPISEVSVSRILKNKKQILMSQIMADKQELKLLSANMDKEEAAQLFSKYSLDYAPVVDEKGILVGVIYANDVIDILQEEAQEDILLLGGVQYANLHASPFSTAKSRVSWLATSLITNLFSATIIAFFAGEIEKIVALAALLPIVSSLSGNSGTQALTVLVRAIATKEINNISLLKILFKEISVAFLNGLILAVIAATACYFWQHNLHLSLVFACAILAAIILSGFFGVFIPLILYRLKFDPAISSGVFLTTITDMFSFLTLLGLANLVL